MISPAQAGNAVATGALTVNGLPQLSSIVGGVGALAAAGHATAEVVLAGMVTTGGCTVVVCVQV